MNLDPRVLAVLQHHAPWTATQDVAGRWHIDAHYAGPERAALRAMEGKIFGAALSGCISATALSRSAREDGMESERVKTRCQCGHTEKMHYDRAGRCKGDGGGCSCCLWWPTAPIEKEVHAERTGGRDGEKEK
jgi:hypothetical protein